MAAVPDEYIDLSALIGDEGYVRERLQVFKDVGVTHLNVNPIGLDSLAGLGYKFGDGSFGYALTHFWEKYFNCCHRDVLRGAKLRLHG